VACTTLGIWASGCGTGQAGEGTPQDSIPAVDTSTIEGRIRHTTGLLQQSPNDGQLWLRRSQLWYEQGNTLQAMEDVSKAIEINITNPAAYHLRGFYYYVQNKDSAALRDLKRAAESGSLDPETFYMIGQLHFFAKDYKGALAGYGDAIKLDSTQPTYYFARGFLYQTQNKVDAAIAEYKTALEWDPKFIKVLLALHDVYLDIKHDADQAYVFNDQLLRIDSLHPVARFNQGNFLLARANRISDEAQNVDFMVLVKLAIAEYTTCINRDPKFVRALYNRGYCYYLLENYGRAKSDFSSVIGLDPLEPKAFFMRGSISEFEGDLENARNDYERAAEIDPQFRDAVNAAKELKSKTLAIDAKKR
jgi:tetratricopeptide (TPR) repeat protein